MAATAKAEPKADAEARGAAAVEGVAEARGARRRAEPKRDGGDGGRRRRSRSAGRGDGAGEVRATVAAAGCAARRRATRRRRRRMRDGEGEVRGGGGGGLRGGGGEEWLRAIPKDRIAAFLEVERACGQARTATVAFADWDFRLYLKFLLQVTPTLCTETESAFSGNKRAVPAEVVKAAKVMADSRLGHEGFEVILDTGSSHLAVAAEGCGGCDNLTRPLYPPAGAAGGAEVTVRYGAGSLSSMWSGRYLSDVVSFPGAAATEEEAAAMGAPLAKTGVLVDAAAILEEAGFFQDSCPLAQGIWGTAYRALTATASPTAIDRLVLSGVPDGFAVEICRPKTPHVPGWPDAASAGGGAGKTGNFWLGGIDSSRASAAFAWMPITEQKWYTVPAESFAVNGAEVAGMTRLDAAKCAVDSGTTDMHMSTKVTATERNVAALTAAIRSSNVLTFAAGVPIDYQDKFWSQDLMLQLPDDKFSFNPDNVTLAVVVSGAHFEIDLRNLIH
ncbi:MAG: aspartic peptidase domain-containing protein, partial [Olpidium bornovanus]